MHQIANFALHSFANSLRIQDNNLNKIKHINFMSLWQHHLLLKTGYTFILCSHETIQNLGHANIASLNCIANLIHVQSYSQTKAFTIISNQFTQALLLISFCHKSTLIPICELLKFLFLLLILLSSS